MAGDAVAVKQLRDLNREMRPCGVLRMEPFPGQALAIRHGMRTHALVELRAFSGGHLGVLLQHLILPYPGQVPSLGGVSDRAPLHIYALSRQIDAFFSPP